jgi:hypothetical protein
VTFQVVLSRGRVATYLASVLCLWCGKIGQLGVLLGPWAVVSPDVPVQVFLLRTLLFANVVRAYQERLVITILGILILAAWYETGDDHLSKCLQG